MFSCRARMFLSYKAPFPLQKSHVISRDIYSVAYMHQQLGHNWFFQSWWRHQMETFSALLAFCTGNSPVTDLLRSQRPVTRSVDVFFDLCLNKRLSKESRRRWLETPWCSLWRHCNEWRIDACRQIITCSNADLLSVRSLGPNFKKVFMEINTLRPRQNGRSFPDDIFKCIFLNENVWNSIKISLKFVPRDPINNIPALVQIMAWRRPGDKPISEPMMFT